MSARRVARLASLALILIGSTGSALVIAGQLAGLDGSAVFPLSVAVGIVALISLRPRTTTRKDITA